MHRHAILLVEDNEDDIELTIRAFAKSGIMNPLHVARDGETAISMLHGDELRPRLVILDLKLPKMDGHDVLRRIRAEEKTRTIPVVVMTSSAQEDDLVKTYANGVNSYLRKPIDFEEFVRVASTLGVYWFGYNLLPPP